MPSTETAFRMTLVLMGLGILFAIREFFYLVKVPTGSMKPAILPGERLLVRRLHHARAARRGDVLVFRSTHRQKGDGQTLMIKRLIGLPGERVELSGGRVLVNGSPLAEPYLLTGVGDDHRFDIPSGAYLFLGDNRRASHDARFWSDPYVRGHDIAGRALFRIWPLNRMGSIQ